MYFNMRCSGSHKDSDLGLILVFEGLTQIPMLSMENSCQHQWELGQTLMGVERRVLSHRGSAVP